MTGRTNHEYRLDGFPKKSGQIPYRYRRPFWLSAANYYVLTASASIVAFVAVFAALHEEAEDAPWVGSAMLAGVVFVAAVFVREVVLRKARARCLLIEKRLDVNSKNVLLPARANKNFGKLTVQENAAMIQDIRHKSDAARRGVKFAEKHLEVFELCNEYIALNKRQMETVGIGSPRLAALRRGREVVEQLHHFHLLSWAQNETRTLTQESKIRATISEKLESAQRALETLNAALQFYPNDQQLLESESALKEFITSIKVSHWIEQAERAAFKGNVKRAINHYRDALFFMARETVQTEQRALIAEKINAEIENLRQMSQTGERENLTKKNLFQ